MCTISTICFRPTFPQFKVLSICLLCLVMCTLVARPLISAICTAGEVKPAAKSSMDAYCVPEQQPEGPLGIENAKSGSKEGFEKHSGHGRLYRPQATLARPPASGERLSLSASAPETACHAAIMLPVSSPQAPLCCAATL